jgi:hypothetical protein
MSSVSEILEHIGHTDQEYAEARDNKNIDALKEKF